MQSAADSELGLHQCSLLLIHDSESTSAESAADSEPSLHQCSLLLIQSRAEPPPVQSAADSELSSTSAVCCSVDCNRQGRKMIPKIRVGCEDCNKVNAVSLMQR